MALNAFVKAKMKKKVTEEEDSADAPVDSADSGDSAEMEAGDTADSAEKPAFPPKKGGAPPFPPKKGVNPFEKKTGGAPAAKGAGNPLMAWMKSKGKK